jgi:hypothetical protein
MICFLLYVFNAVYNNLRTCGGYIYSYLAEINKHVIASSCRFLAFNYAIFWIDFSNMLIE